MLTQAEAHQQILESLNPQNTEAVQSSPDMLKSTQQTYRESLTEIMNQVKKNKKSAPEILKIKNITELIASFNWIDTTQEKVAPEDGKNIHCRILNLDSETAKQRKTRITFEYNNGKFEIQISPTQVSSPFAGIYLLHVLGICEEYQKANGKRYGDIQSIAKYLAFEKIQFILSSFHQENIRIQDQLKALKIKSQTDIDKLLSSDPKFHLFVAHTSESYFKGSAPTEGEKIDRINIILTALYYQIIASTDHTENEKIEEFQQANEKIKSHLHLVYTELKSAALQREAALFTSDKTKVY